MVSIHSATALLFEAQVDQVFPSDENHTNAKHFDRIVAN